MMHGWMDEKGGQRGGGGGLTDSGKNRWVANRDKRVRGSNTACKKQIMMNVVLLLPE